MLCQPFKLALRSAEIIRDHPIAFALQNLQAPVIFWQGLPFLISEVQVHYFGIPGGIPGALVFFSCVFAFYLCMFGLLYIWISNMFFWEQDKELFIKYLWMRVLEMVLIVAAHVAYFVLLFASVALIIYLNI